MSNVPERLAGKYLKRYIISFWCRISQIILSDLCIISLYINSLYIISNKYKNVKIYKIALLIIARCEIDEIFYDVISYIKLGICN